MKTAVSKGTYILGNLYSIGVTKILKNQEVILHEPDEKCTRVTIGNNVCKISNSQVPLFFTVTGELQELKRSDTYEEY